MTRSKKVSSLFREIFSWPTLVAIALALFLVSTTLKNVPAGQKLVVLSYYGEGALIGACIVLTINWWFDRSSQPPPSK